MKKTTKRKWVAFICLLLVVIMVLGVILPALLSADILDEERRLKEIQDQKKLTAQLSQKRIQELKALQNSLSELEADLHVLDDQVIEVELQINDLDDQIADKEDEINQREIDLSNERAKEAQYEGLWRARLQSMYETRKMSLIELLLTSSSVKDFLVRLEYQRNTIQYDNMIMQGIVDNRLAIENNIATIQNIKQELEQDLVEANLKEQELMELRSEKNQKLAEVNEQTEKVEIELEKLMLEEVELESKAARAEEEINRLKKEESELRKWQELHSSWASLSTSKTLDGLSFLWPLWGNLSITGNWGYRTHPINKTWYLHTGVDIGARTGTEVHAIESGEVIRTIVQSTGLGYYVVIKHNNHVQSYYCHLSKILVSKGQYVKRGDVIGLVGSTGDATGPHLHLGLYIDNVCVDPVLYVPKAYPKD